MDRNLYKINFLDQYFKHPYTIEAIPGDCSPRSYDRIRYKNQNFILMNAPTNLINLEPFINIDKILLENGFSAPKIYDIDYKNGFLLSEDFGKNSFNNILSKLSGKNLLQKEEEIYQYATDLLINIHQIDLTSINLPKYDNNLLLKEFQTFVDYYLKHIKNQDLSKNQQNEFYNIWLEIFKNLSNDQFLILRDYHADNLFFLDDRKSYQKIGLIDFQDAVLGSRAYDLLSMLQDARRDVSNNLEKNMIDYYIKTTNIDGIKFNIDYEILSLQRNVKILGIFARQGIEYKNTQYLDLIPRVMSYVTSSLNNNNLFDDLKLFLKW
jgi:aminoglycoside/choline kinase family phosphotransferase